MCFIRLVFMRLLFNPFAPFQTHADFQVHAAAKQQGKRDLQQFSDVPRSVFMDALRMECTPFVFTYKNRKDEVHQRLVFGKGEKYF